MAARANRDDSEIVFEEQEEDVEGMGELEIDDASLEQAQQDQNQNEEDEKDETKEESVPMKAAAAVTEPTAEDDDMKASFDLSTKKKKKKTTKKADGEEEQPAAAEDGADDLSQFELGLKKKKKTKKAVVEQKDTPDAERDFQYTELLERIFKVIREKNPNLAVRKRYVMPPPQLVRIGAKKTMWSNFQHMCEQMHRQPEHVLQFFLAELGTEGSIDGSQRLVIKGRYMPKQIESLLKKYITEYVTCSVCHNPETTLTRDAMTRLYFLECTSCRSKRSVVPIKAGFHAIGKGERRAAKAKQ